MFPNSSSQILLTLLLLLLSSVFSFRGHGVLRRGTAITKSRYHLSDARRSCTSQIKEKAVNKTAISLSPESFVHSEDLRWCQYLSQHPLLNPITSTVFNTISNMLVFDHLNHAVLVGPNQLPSLYKSLLKASKILNMDAPDLYVQHNTIPNANTLAYQGAKPFILLNTGLLDLLDNHEIEAVIAHELGHLKCNHGPWLSLLNLINIFAATPAGFLLQPMKPWLDKWRYAAEFSCDRASLLVAKDFNVVASTIMKLCGGSAKSRFQKELNVEAFLQQPLRLKESFSSVANFPLIQGISTQSRPLPFERLHQLRQWSSSKQFVDLLTLIS